MRTFLRTGRRSGPGQQQAGRGCSFRPGLECLEERSLLSANFFQNNLISDIPGLAATTDGRFLNPWGITAGLGAQDA